MTAGVIGALIGLGVAVVDFFLLRRLASRVDLPETRQVLNITALSQFVLMPVAGWFAGSLIFGE
jgi:hypothetical protein